MYNGPPLPLQEYHTPYSSYDSIQNCREVSDRVTTEEHVPSTNPSIWIYNISIKVRKWLKGCIPTTLEHQNESEQIVNPFVLKLLRSTEQKPCFFGQGFLYEQRSGCPPAQHTKSCRGIFLNAQYILPISVVSI